MQETKKKTQPWDSDTKNSIESILIKTKFHRLILKTKIYKELYLLLQRAYYLLSYNFFESFKKMPKKRSQGSSVGRKYKSSRCKSGAESAPKPTRDSITFVSPPFKRRRQNNPSICTAVNSATLPPSSLPPSSLARYLINFFLQLEKMHDSKLWKTITLARKKLEEEEALKETAQQSKSTTTSLVDVINLVHDDSSVSSKEWEEEQQGVPPAPTEDTRKYLPKK